MTPLRLCEKRVCKRHEKSTAGAGLRPEPRETVYFCVKCAEGGSPKALTIKSSMKVIHIFRMKIDYVRVTDHDQMEAPN